MVGESSPLLFDALADLAARRPDEQLYTYVDEKGQEQARLTTCETLDRVARTAGALVQEAGLRPEQRVLLAYPPGLELVLALLGCMHAGVVPVPVALPLGGCETLAAIAADCEASAILSSRAYSESKGHAQARAALQALGCSLPWHASDALGPAAAIESVRPRPEDLALIQYTSGSTRAPRGVCVSYANLEHQLRFERRYLRSSPECCYLFWLPHYHDFALIAAIFGAVHGNGSLVLTSPMTFLRRPGMWAELMTRYRATHTAAPDASYRMLVDRSSPEERAGWDLSSLTIMASAAEPIRARTVDDLLAALESTGLPRESFCPCYGLAEHTVGVTIGGKLRVRASRRALEQEGRIREPRDPEDALELFGCGPAVMDIELRIVDPESRRALPEGEVGEVWIDSPSKCMGYYGRAEESRETFEAELVGDRARWLRTADLGALVEGELVITGRIKDLVILQGRNIYPQDVEELACEAHPSIRAGHVACFGCPAEDGLEEMIVVAELRKAAARDEEELGSVARAVRAAVRRELQIAGFTLVLAAPGSVPRTSSGKLRRAACRSAWLRDALEWYGVDRGMGLTSRGSGKP